MKRVLTAAILIPVVVAVNFYAPELVARAFLAAVGLACLYEFFEIASHSGARPFREIGLAACFLLIFFEKIPQPAFFVILAVLLLISAMRPASRPLGSALPAAGATLFGVIYAGGPFALGAEIHLRNPHWLFYILVISWFSDSAAYYVGRNFGRRPLAPSISPNKTWEGAIASALAGTMAGWGYWHYFLGEAELAVGLAVALALLTNLACQVGDLAESAIKRGADVKDSGSLLPGHGGMLDRLDGVLFALPVVYLFLNFFG